MLSIDLRHSETDLSPELAVEGQNEYRLEIRNFGARLRVDVEGDRSWCACYKLSRHR